jgi:hypothetical protein
MNETDVIEALDQACQGLNLVFQVVHEAETLYVYVNRPEAKQSFSHETLTEMIQGAIASHQESAAHQESAPLQPPHLQTLHLYSRELGTVEPDWETSIVLSSAEADMPEAPPEKISAVVQPESIEAETLEIESLEIESQISSSDLSQYCFTRNRALLTSEILPPNEKIASLVQSFHTLSFLDKLSALPHVENFFRANSLPPLNDLNAQTQAWLHQLEQIDAANLRKTAIWMSRYCLNPETAMSQVVVVLPLAEVTDTTAAASEAAAPQSLVQRMLATPAEPSLEMYSAAAPARPRPAPSEPAMPPLQPVMSPAAVHKPRPRFVWQMLLVPVIWLLFTATAVTYSVQAQNNPQALVALCKTAKGSQPYCQLAAQLIGPDVMERFIKGTEAPMVEGVMERSVQDCALAGYFNAGFTLKDVRESSTPKNPITSLQQETIFPGLFFVDLQHVDKAGGTVRTACAYRQGVDPVMLRERSVKLASAVIPTDWPTQPFKSKTRLATLQSSLTAHGVLSHLGTSTLFTAIGLFVAVYLGLGISVDSLETIYKSAFFLGISETITGFIPMVGFLRIAVLEVLALMLTTVVVKDLELDWAAGYRWVACGGLTIIMIRAILNWLMLVAIVSLMG